jgi:hypothetical protein
MPISSGPDLLGENNLALGYDTGDVTNSYKGAPTTNICTGANFSIYNDGATNLRNQSYPPPPIPGYEVVKVTANTPGVYGQSILWRAGYSTSPATVTNSVYAWLESGTFVQVGQHWFPWNYGSAKTIERGKWVRISETYNINEGGSYGEAAMVYSTNGVAYFCMPQYELKPYMTPFVNFLSTRSETQGLLSLVGTNTIDLTNVSFNSNAQMVFDGTNDYVNVPYNTSHNLTNQGTISTWINPSTLTQGSFAGIVAQCTGGGTNQQAYTLSWRQVSNAFLGQICNGSGTYNEIYANLPTVANVWYNIVFTWNGSQLTMYNNAIVIGAATQTVNCQVLATDLTIGGFTYKGAGGSGESFNGSISKVKIYNRGLTSQEVRQKYQQYKTRFNLS